MLVLSIHCMRRPPASAQYSYTRRCTAFTYPPHSFLRQLLLFVFCRGQRRQPTVSTLDSYLPPYNTLFGVAFAGAPWFACGLALAASAKPCDAADIAQRARAPRLVRNPHAARPRPAPSRTGGPVPRAGHMPCDGVGVRVRGLLAT